MEKYEENVTEIMHTLNEVDGKTNNTVSVEQNINIVNVEMGKHSMWDRVDFPALKEWIHDHMSQTILGVILAIYTVVLIILSLNVARYRDALGTKEEVPAVTQEENYSTIETVIEPTEDLVEPIIEVVQEKEMQEDIVKEETVPEEEPEIAEISEPVTERALYDLNIIGDNRSEKRAKVVNTVGEELEDVFYLTGGLYNETVAFYLNGEYDRLTANLSCEENCRSSFDVNVYLDDGPCVETIRVQRIMARTPIDIDTTGATFIKFEIVGSIKSQGAILSDGVLYVSEIEE